MKSLTRTLTAVLLSGIFIAGCTPSATNAVADSGLTEKLEAAKKELETFKNDKAKEIESLNQQITDLKGKLESLTSTQAITNAADTTQPAVENKTMEYFPVYSKDPNTMEPYTLCYIGIDPSKDLKGKLDEITSKLSRISFRYNEMTYDIVDQDGKKILKVNLIDKANWETIFAGSTGGSINSYTLVNTLLQKEYKGEWIDGVSFTADGDKAMFEHAPQLEKTIMRTDN